jgi:hypothetical protein
MYLTAATDYQATLHKFNQLTHKTNQDARRSEPSGVDILIVKLDAQTGSIEWTQQLISTGDDLPTKVSIGPDDKYDFQLLSTILMKYIIDYMSVDPLKEN